ncbi:MAG: AEC family transporter [Pseudomonadota bacterium]
MEVFELILPIFAIIVAGMIVGHFKILPEAAGDILIQFAFWVAIPALMFLIISRESIDRLLNVGFYVAFGGGSLIVFLAVLFGARHLRKMNLAQASVLALATVLSNTAFVALPILYEVFGHRAVLPAALAIVMTVVVILLGVVLLDQATATEDGAGGSVLKTARDGLLNPIVLATVLGIAYAVTGLELPAVAVHFLTPLSEAVTPCALFAIGMSIRLKALKTGMGEILFAAIVKVIVLPALILLLARIMGLDPIMTIAAVICAAVPTGKNVFILAGQYNVSKDFAAATISVTSVAAIVTLLAWLFILAQIYPATVPT